ncbi:MAG: hypothetical protein KDA61_10160, partial [Planctomycetales bacterium]|nr:hypothetical protein [Planctomycetales bacterium]
MRCSLLRDGRYLYLLISALTLDGYLTLRLFAATRYDDAGRLQDAKAVWGFPAAFYVERGAST